jgi:protein-tyrosine phosphatase
MLHRVPTTPDALVSERLSTAWPSVPNFRDAGGHETRDGARVRTGLLYRSVALDGASEDDLRTLGDLGVRTIFDLRTAMEQERRPDRLPDGATHMALDLLVDSGESDPAAVFALMQDPPRASRELGDGGTERFYVATYRDMIGLPSARAGYARLYRSLAQPDHRPALVHCTTGKDRTGWAVAALLLFLGVRADVVMREYLISDLEIRRAFEHVIEDFVARGGRRDVIEPLMSVKPSFLDAAQDVMHAEYGSIDGYFRDGLELDEAVLSELRSAFVERP